MWPPMGSPLKSNSISKNLPWKFNVNGDSLETHREDSTNRDALSFLIVRALPNASNNVPVCTSRSFVSLTKGSAPETSTRNCKTILAASVLPEPLSPENKDFPKGFAFEEQSRTCNDDTLILVPVIEPSISRSSNCISKKVHWYQPLNPLQQTLTYAVVTETVPYSHTLPPNPPNTTQAAYKDLQRSTHSLYKCRCDPAWISAANFQWTFPRWEGQVKRNPTLQPPPPDRALHRPLHTCRQRGI